MASVTVRNLPDEVHRALRVRVTLIDGDYVQAVEALLNGAELA